MDIAQLFNIISGITSGGRSESIPSALHPPYAQLYQVSVYKMVSGDTDPRRKSDSVIKQPKARSSPRGSVPSSPAISPASSPAGSPPVRTFFPDISNPNSPCSSDNEPNQKKSRIKKSQCPCGQSSGGESWLLSCSSCNQTWHNGCAGLKCSAFTKPVLESLAKKWQCPWCYVCPFPRPATHKGAKDGQTLLSETAVASLIVNVTEKLAESVTSSLQPTYEKTVSSIENQLKSLTNEINEFKQKSVHVLNNQPPSDTFGLSSPSEPITLTVKCDEKPVLDDRLDYLNVDDISEISTHLKECQDQELFKSKNGRSTISYGVQYTYSGSTDQPASAEMPICMKKLIDKIKADYELPENLVPNSILVNHYPKKTSARDPPSSLPNHSDNEVEIQPGSSIFKYSLGAPRTVIFSGIHSEETEPHVASHNSLYVMTRASQAWFKHQVMDVEKCEERFSITLRTVSPKNKRSTILVGDSNTVPIKFGSGKGTVGESYPGIRVKAARIKDIDPSFCCEYANVVIACGTNDLRVDSVGRSNPDEYIQQLVATLRDKMEQIRLLSPDTNIIMMPVLPSRDSKMNEHICKFNSIVFGSEFRHALQVTMPPLYSFLDKKNLLAINLTRDSDPIHLGIKGISMFVRIIKEAIFRTGQGHFRTPSSGFRKPP